MGGVPRQVERGLAGRVGSADNGDRLPGEGRGLDAGSAVEDPDAGETLERRDLDPAVVHPGGDDDGPGPHRRPVGKGQLTDVAISPHRTRSTAEHEFRPQEYRLLPRPVRQLATADAARE